MLGLPPGSRACLFDMDGVLTDTTPLHARAWKEAFDAFLDAWATSGGEGQRPFDIETDYERYVDGMPRADGVRSFLRSRGIELPDGDADDPADAATVAGVGRRKNELLHRVIDRDGVDPYPGSVRYLDAARDGDVAVAVVSASENARPVLRAAGILDRFGVVIDGRAVAERDLHGKPAPDTFLAAARDLGVAPDEAVVFEDALAGVEAGRAGGFGTVIGIDRVGHGHAAALREHGADRTVADLAELIDAA